MLTELYHSTTNNNKQQALKEKRAAQVESNAALLAENAEMEAIFCKNTKDHDDLASVTKEAKAKFASFEREYIKLQEDEKHVKEKIKKQKKANEKVLSFLFFFLSFFLSFFFSFFLFFQILTTTNS